MSSRNRHLLPILVLFGALAPGLAAGQFGPKPDVSPLAPSTLKGPIFDTTTPVYSASHATEQRATTVVAEVDGRPVTLGDVADAIRDLPVGMQAMDYTEIFPIVLKELVVRQALDVRAQHRGLDEDPVVRRRMKAASDRVLAEELLRQEGSMGISEQDLLQRYGSTIAGKPGPEEVHVRVIMVPTEAAAIRMIGELLSGADFATLAKRSSEDPSASVGGDLGFVIREAVNPEISGIAFATHAGQVAATPVLSNGGWFVVKVEERRKQPTPAFSAVREQLINAMILQAGPDVAKRALADITVQEYSISGKEAVDQAGQTARGVRQSAK